MVGPNRVDGAVGQSPPQPILILLVAQWWLDFAHTDSTPREVFVVRGAAEVVRARFEQDLVPALARRGGRIHRQPNCRVWHVQRTARQLRQPYRPQHILLFAKRGSRLA